MRLHRALAAPLLALLLLAPSVAAGSAEAPDIVDNPENFAPDRDLLAAWVEPGPRGMHVTIRIEGANAAPQDVLYALLFTIDDGSLTKTQYVAGVARGADGALHGIVRPSGFDRAGVEGPETFPADALSDLAFEPGTPAHARFVIPWDVVPGWEPGQDVHSLGSETALYRRSSGSWTDLDLAQTTQTLTLDKSLLTPGARAALPWLLGPTAAIVAGAIGWVVWRSRRGGGMQVTLKPRGPGDAPPAEADSADAATPRLKLDPRR